MDYWYEFNSIIINCLERPFIFQYKKNAFYTFKFVGHAGHDEPKNSTRKVPPVKGNEQRFGLDGQIQHKVNGKKLKIIIFIK